MKTKITLFAAMMLFAFSQAQYLKVEGKTLKTANGTPLILKGMNYPILDDGDVDFNVASTYQTKINEFVKTGANAIRIPWNTNGVHWRDVNVPGTLQSYIDNGKLAAFIDYCTSKGLYTILEIHDLTCTNDWATFNTKIMDFWKQTAIKNIINARQDRVIINFANEFGSDTAWGGSTTDFTNNYAAAVASLRTEGYKVPLMIDAPDCGMASSTLVNNSAATIYNADNLKNVIFSAHTYWVGYANNNAAIDAKMLEMKNSPYYFFLGEIANIQDANACGDTDINHIYKRVLTKACEYGIGWLAWSYYKDCAAQRQVTTTGMFANLTTYGNDIVNNSVYGLKSTTCYSTLAVGNQMLDMKGVRIVPNPVKDDFKIESDKKVVSVQAFDFSGKLLKLKTTDNHEFKIQASTSVVNLKIKLEDGSEVTKKLIIEK